MALYIVKKVNRRAATEILMRDVQTGEACNEFILIGWAVPQISHAKPR